MTEHRSATPVNRLSVVASLLFAALLGFGLPGPCSAAAADAKQTARERVGKPVQAAEQLLKQKKYKEALAKLHRPWFAGGTINIASVQADRFVFAPGAAAF